MMMMVHFRGQGLITCQWQPITHWWLYFVQGLVCHIWTFERRKCRIKWFHFSWQHLFIRPELASELRWPAYPNLATLSTLFFVGLLEDALIVHTNLPQTFAVGGAYGN